LRVSIRVIVPFFGFPIALQAVVQLTQQLGDFLMAVIHRQKNEKPRWPLIYQGIECVVTTRTFTNEVLK
jgi:hypothetical protein